MLSIICFINETAKLNLCQSRPCAFSHSADNKDFSSPLLYQSSSGYCIFAENTLSLQTETIITFMSTQIKTQQSKLHNRGSVVYLIFVLISLLTLSCNKGKESKNISEEHLDSALADISLFDDSTICQTDTSEVISEKELRTYNKYQTFNEYKLKGEGKVYNSPFVYVKTINDTIIVRVSDNKNHSVRYIKKDGIWQSHQELDMQKKGMPIAKSSKEKPARSYYRIFKGDSIIELACRFLDEYPTQDVYIKTKKGCVQISLNKQEYVKDTKHPYHEIMKIVSDYNNGKFETSTPIQRTYNYTLSQNAKYFYYVCAIRDTQGREHHLDTITISKTSLLDFGVGPGLIENMLIEDE